MSLQTKLVELTTELDGKSPFEQSMPCAYSMHILLAGGLRLGKTTPVKFRFIYSIGGINAEILPV